MPRNPGLSDAIPLGLPPFQPTECPSSGLLHRREIELLAGLAPSNLCNPCNPCNAYYSFSDVLMVGAIGAVRRRLRLREAQAFPPGRALEPYPVAFDLFNLVAFD